MKQKYKIYEILISLALFTQLNVSNLISTETQLRVTESNLFESHDTNVYVIDFSKNDKINKKFSFVCSSGPNALDLNLTFTGLDSKIEKVLN